VDSVETNKHVFNFFSPSGSYTILVFHTKRYGDVPKGSPLTGASNAGGVGTNRDSRPIMAIGSMTAGVQATIATVDRAVYRTDGDASVNVCLSQPTAWTTTTKRRERTEQNLVYAAIKGCL